MSIENAKKFVKDLETDENLQKILSESESAPEKVGNFLEEVKNLGYDFKEEELMEVVMGESKLSEENLAGVSGGTYTDMQLKKLLKDLEERKRLGLISFF